MSSIFSVFPKINIYVAKNAKVDKKKKAIAKFGTVHYVTFEKIWK